MEIKPRLLAYIWLPALLFSACDLLDRASSGLFPGKAYRVEILWEREINVSTRISGHPLIEGRYCYLPAKENYAGGDPNIVKVNMETGRVEWETSGIRNSSNNPHKIGSYIYVLGGTGILFVYNDSNGSLAATVRLGNDATEATNNAREYYSSEAVSGSYLFWGKNGLMRFDSRLIVFSTPPGTIQNIAPEKVWSKSGQPQIYVNIIPENGRLYFITRSSMPENPGVLIALNAETGNVIWKRSAPRCQGSDYFSLVLNGNKLLVVEETFSSYDKLTGVPVLENIPLGYIKRSYEPGKITLYNNRLFNVGRWDLVSVNADTGRVIWSVSPADNSADEFANEFGASPLVNNGKVFILHSDGLHVYNADTGRFIGADGSFSKNTYWVYSQAIGIYKDAYIFFNASQKYVTAIR